MAETDVIPTPDVSWPPVADDKWQREHAAFLRLKNELLITHPGKYVAVHDGQVVEIGDDKIDVALRAYDKCSYVPIYVGLVTDQPQPIRRIPSPRRFSDAGTS